MSLIKKIALILVSFLLIFIGLTPFVFKGQNGRRASSNSDKAVIIIDAGHGGFDGGAVAGDGTVEKDINLNISLCLSELLAFNGYDVVLTRNSDTGTEDDASKPIQTRKVSDLKNRLALMNKYDDAIFVSIHLNKFNSAAAKGAQVFYAPKNSDSARLGQSVQTAVKNLLQPDNERLIKKATKSTYLLYNAEIPAVIVECGFLSNAAELKLLKNEEYQRQMAFAVYSGINEYFNGEK